MTEHPAHGLAAMAASTAEELHGCVNPADPFSARLTAADRLDLLPRLYSTVSQLAACIATLAVDTADKAAGKWLLEGAERIETGSYSVRVAYNLLANDRGDQPGPARSAEARPARVTASNSGSATQGSGTLPTPRVLTAENFPQGPAAGLRQDNRAAPSSGRSARNKAGTQPDQSPRATRRRGQ